MVAKSLRGVECKNEKKLNFFNFAFILEKTYSRNIFFKARSMAGRLEKCIRRCRSSFKYELKIKIIFNKQISLYI